jgi:hypothetical protein
MGIKFEISTHLRIRRHSRAQGIRRDKYRTEAATSRTRCYDEYKSTQVKGAHAKLRCVRALVCYPFRLPYLLVPSQYHKSLSSRNQKRHIFSERKQSSLARAILDRAAKDISCSSDKRLNLSPLATHLHSTMWSDVMARRMSQL